MRLTLIVLLPFLGALFAAFLPAKARNIASWLSGLVTVACTALIISLYSKIGAEGVVRARVDWAPHLGLELYLRMEDKSGRKLRLTDDDRLVPLGEE